MSAVLKHVVAAHPDWIIDYQAEEGKHQVGRGIVANTFAYGQPYPSPHYDFETQIILYDTWYGWDDRPNTRVSSCLRERFCLGWNSEYSRYSVKVSERAARLAGLLLKREKCVAIHYDGDSSPSKKNLSHSQAENICRDIDRLGYNPLILDWRRRSPLNYHRLTAPESWGGNAEMVCAVINRCSAFVGIDSGPAKCASATNVPSLVVWTGHHPAQFHDPAPNTTHLVPVGYHKLEPMCSNQSVTDWFEANYQVRIYEQDPVDEVNRWLKEVLA